MREKEKSKKKKYGGSVNAVAADYRFFFVSFCFRFLAETTGIVFANFDVRCERFGIINLK